MGHWLDDIESQEKKKSRSASSSARVQDKKFRIQQNYEKNKKLYDGFIEKLNELVDRVNELPVEHREVFGKISSKEKQSKLDNKLHYFSSSRRKTKVQFKNLLRPLSNVHFKHVRLIYFNVAKIMDKVEIEIKEDLLEKKRKDGKLDTDLDKHKSKKPREEDREGFHNVYYYDMNLLTDELAYKIIDWLAFHEDLGHLPVIHDGEPRFRD